MAVLAVVWLFCGILAAAIAGSRGASGCLAFILGALLGPIGIIIACVLPVEQRALPQASMAQAPPKRECPHCLSCIGYSATVCPQCQRESEPAGPELLATGVPYQCAAGPEHRWVLSRKRPGMYGCERCLLYVTPGVFVK